MLKKCSLQKYSDREKTSDDVRLPTAKEMRQMIRNYHDLSGTAGELRRYDIECDNLSRAAYWTRELDEPYEPGISVFEDNNVLVRQRVTEAKSCLVRPVQSANTVLAFGGQLNRYGLPDEKSELFAQQLRET